MKRFNINTPPGVRLIERRYILIRPDGIRVDLGMSLMEMRKNYKAAIATGVDTAAWQMIMQLCDQREGQDHCWPWMGPRDRDGYGLYSGKRVQRLIMLHVRGRPVSDRKVVMHTCDNPCCCNPSHLRIGTARANVLDRVSKNRSAQGESNGRSVLTADAVTQIRESHASLSETASTHQISKWTVRDIRRNKTWRK